MKGQKKKKRYPVWIDNLSHLAEYGVVGACPHCSSENTHYGYTAIGNGELGYGAVWCSDCKRGMHLCRIKIADVKNMGEPIPPDIMYVY